MLDKMIIRIAITVFILVGIGGYALYESRNLIRGPIVIIEEPVNGQMSNSAVADIRGRVKNIVKISMNDRSITVDESGVFSEKFVLSNGNNMVKVSAEDRFGRVAEKYVQILYAEPSEPLVQR